MSRNYVWLLPEEPNYSELLKEKKKIAFQKNGVEKVLGISKTRYMLSYSFQVSMSYGSIYMPN